MFLAHDTSTQGLFENREHYTEFLEGVSSPSFLIVTTSPTLN